MGRFSVAFTHSLRGRSALLVAAVWASAGCTASDDGGDAQGDVGTTSGASTGVPGASGEGDTTHGEPEGDTTSGVDEGTSGDDASSGGSTGEIPPDSEGLCERTPADVGVVVEDAAALVAALASAAPGDVFRLAPGDYGAMPSLPDGVTLVSDDPLAPASFSRGFVSGVRDLTLDALVFDYTYEDGDHDTANRFGFTNAENLTIRNSWFDGDADASGRYMGRGLRVIGADGFTMHCNDFSKFWTGASVGHGGSGATSVDVHVYGNDVHDIRSDGFKFGDNVNLRVERNYLHDFGGVAGAGDHRDMIQLGGDIEGLQIRDNLFDMNEGYYAQTLWSDSQQQMRQIEVVGNIVLNAHTHGISMHNIMDVSIEDNIVAPVPREETGGVTVPRINLSAGGSVVVRGNTVPGIIGQDDHWVVEDNTLVELDHHEVRATARLDPRWAPFFS